MITNKRIEEIIEKHINWKGGVIKCAHIHAAIKEAVDEDRKAIISFIEEKDERVIETINCLGKLSNGGQ